MPEPETHEYEVLPALSGCWAKIQRADESIAILDREIVGFLNRKPSPYEVIRQFQADGKEYAFIVRGNPVVPARIPVLAGEIIHHLRSSLDHLITALVIRNGCTPSGRESFPVCRSVKEWRGACSDGRIASIADTAKDIIGSKQPYHDSMPDNHFLPVMHDMDIRDKHALLIVVATAAQLGQNITIGSNAEIAKRLGINTLPAIVRFGDPRARRVTEAGVEVWKITLAEPCPAFEADADIQFQVAFHKCGKARLIPVIEGLRIMIGATAALVDSFKGEF